MEVIITKAVPDDAEEILECLKIIGGESDNLTFGAEGLPFSVEDERQYLAYLQDSTSSVMYVAKVDGKIVGTASFDGYPRERMKHRGGISVALVKSQWGKGIGSMMMEKLIAFAKEEAKAEIISLEVRSDNAAAIHLYEKYGFENIGTFKGFFKIHGEYVDCELMNLYLN